MINVLFILLILYLLGVYSYILFSIYLSKFFKDKRLMSFKLIIGCLASWLGVLNVFFSYDFDDISNSIINI